jgi:hypothetical protein
MHPTGFNSWSHYFSFALARQFIPAPGQRLEHEENCVEKVGGSMAALVIKPLDCFLQKITHPVVLLALTVAALGCVSIAFYPVYTLQVATTIFPFLKYITAAHIHAALFIILQTSIGGLGVRTLGRLHNQPLLTAYQRATLVALPIGARAL